MAKTSPPRRIRATDLAEMGFCETKCLLKAQHGEVDTPASAEAKRAGHREHEAFHARVTEHHNQARQDVRATVTDGRCFIASAVYGPNDWRTEQLRRYRDTVLLPSRVGRQVVAMYYACSPVIARWIGSRPIAVRLVRRALDLARHRIVLIHPGKEAYHDVQDHPR